MVTVGFIASLENSKFRIPQESNSQFAFVEIGAR